MSEDIHFLRAKPLSMKTTRSNSHDEVLRRVMRHNLREIQSEFGERSDSVIDPRRICFNEILFGLDTSDGVAEVAHEAMLTERVRRRANAALGIEIVCSVPNGLTIDYRAYFKDAAQWAEKYFDVPMLSAIIHSDEDYPHVHIVMLPMREGKLIASELLGDRKTTKSMQADFHEQVGKRYGLRLPRPQKRHSAVVRLAAAQIAIDALHDNGELCATADAIVGELRALIAANPEKLLSLMGRAMPAPTLIKGDFAKMMTRPCKPEKPNRTFDNRLIGDSGSGKSSKFEPEKQKSYALIGDSFSSPSFPSPNEPQTNASTPQAEPATTTASTCITAASAADTEPLQADPPAAADDINEPADQITRERDSDHRTDEWNLDTGEFVAIKPTSRATHNAIAVASVHVALGGIGTAPPRPP